MLNGWFGLLGSNWGYHELRNPLQSKPQPRSTHKKDQIEAINSNVIYDWRHLITRSTVVGGPLSSCFPSCFGLSLHGSVAGPPTPPTIWGTSLSCRNWTAQWWLMSNWGWEPIGISPNLLGSKPLPKKKRAIRSKGTDDLLYFWGAQQML